MLGHQVAVFYVQYSVVFLVRLLLTIIRIASLCLYKDWTKCIGGLTLDDGTPLPVLLQYLRNRDPLIMFFFCTYRYYALEQYSKHLPIIFKIMLNIYASVPILCMLDG